MSAVDAPVAAAPPAAGAGAGAGAADAVLMLPLLFLLLLLLLLLPGDDGHPGMLGISSRCSRAVHAHTQGVGRREYFHMVSVYVYVWV